MDYVNNTPPRIIQSAGFCMEHSAKSRSIGYENENAPTLRAGVVPGVVCEMMEEQMNTEYIVRRLTPTECQRLQGFPDGYTDGLENDDPSEEEIEFWKHAFEEYGKPKNEKYIRKWLANPKTDAAEYKMWGNGWALPNALYFMEGIKEQLERT